jgi:hypothetical protein
MDEIEGRIGARPNTLVIGKQVWNQLRWHPDLLDSIKWTQRGVLTEDLVASLLGVERLLIGRALVTTTPEGTAESSVTYSRLGQVGAVPVRAPSAGLRQPAAGYTFTWAACPARLATWSATATTSARPTSSRPTATGSTRSRPAGRAPTSPRWWRSDGRQGDGRRALLGAASLRLRPTVARSRPGLRADRLGPRRAPGAPRLHGAAGRDASTVTCAPCGAEFIGDGERRGHGDKRHRVRSLDPREEDRLVDREERVLEQVAPLYLDKTAATRAG